MMAIITTRRCCLVLVALLQMCIHVNTKMNVLFLVSDDMRPELGSYAGKDCPSPIHPKMHTPNLDKLAAKSLLLKQAYVQQAWCGPSRTSLLTGRRPDTTHVYNLTTYWRNVGGNFTTIPQFFKENGYITQGIGKIFHPGRSSGGNDPISWTEPYFSGHDYSYGGFVSWAAVPKNFTDRYPLLDMQIANHAIQSLQNLSTKAKAGQPFFLAVGVHRPHVPWKFPERFLDYYPMEDIKVAPNPYVPKNFPTIAWNSCKGLAAFNDIKATNSTLSFNTTVPDETARLIRRAYYASVSYTDDNLGRVLDELDAQGLADNTIVVFFGDHGWQLGEHNEWCKHTDFELATHAPMFIHVPGITDLGIVTEHMTEFVDLFPTLSELTGFPKIPTCPQNSTDITLCTEGTSLVPLMKNPQRQDWKQRVFSQFPRPVYVTPTDPHDRYMGYTMRTAHYRYTEWVRFLAAPEYKPLWNESVGVELYDHGKDPAENVNVAQDTAYKVIAQGLSELLHQGWRNALPRPY